MNHGIKISLVDFCDTQFVLLVTLGPEPAFGRLGLGGSSGGFSSHGYTSNASLRAFGAQLGVTEHEVHVGLVFDGRSRKGHLKN